MRMEERYYQKIDKISLLYDYYIIIDTEEYISQRVFRQNELKVHIVSEFAKDDTNYIVIFCKCRKRDRLGFIFAIQDLPRNMILCGHKDYLVWCRDFFKKLDEGRESL